MNYTEQYAFAKKSAEKAIRGGQNIVLLGSGANGKSHLIDELKTELRNSCYTVLGEPMRGATSREFDETVAYSRADKWIMGTNHTECLHGALRHTDFVLVNMSQYVYPKHTKLRSGRRITA